MTFEFLMLSNTAGRVDRLHSHGMDLFFTAEKKFEVLPISLSAPLADLVFPNLFTPHTRDLTIQGRHLSSTPQEVGFCVKLSVHMSVRE